MLHGICQRIVDILNAGRVVLHSIILHPVATIVPLHAWVNTPIVMTWQEWLVALTLAFEGFQLAGYINRAVAVVTNIKRNHANRVAGNEKLVLLFVVEHKGKDAAEVFQEVDALLTIEGQDDLAVRACLELVLTSIATTNLLVVIYLSIDSQHLFVVWREERLSA